MSDVAEMGGFVFACGARQGDGRLITASVCGEIAVFGVG